MVNSILSPLANNVPIVDPATGHPTPYFQRMLQQWMKENGITDGVASGAAPQAELDALEATVAGLNLDALTDVDTTTTPPTDGQTLVYDDTSGLWLPDTPIGGGGGLTLIGTATGGAPTMTVSGIPAGYTDLIYSIAVRTGGASAELRAQFNSDASASYDIHRHYGGTSTGSNQMISQSYFRELTYTENAPNASYFVMCTGTIPFYSNTNMFKTLINQAYQAATGVTTGGYVINNSGKWRSTAAVNRIDFTNSTGANFDANSILKVWGRV